MKILKTNFLTFVLANSLALTSCLQQLDDRPQSFVRVYGSEGTSWVEGMTKLNNGHLLLFGDEARPANGNVPEVDVPFLVETDEFGNQVRHRTYGFFEGEFKMRLTSLDSLFPGAFSTNEFKAYYAWFDGVKQLRDGSFICLGWFGFEGSPTGGIYTVKFYLLLDENLEPTKWEYFDDSQVEEFPKYFSTVYSQMIELNSGEIIFTSKYRERDDNANTVNRGFALYKFSRKTGITNLFRYPSNNPDLTFQPYGISLSADGSSVIINVNQDPEGSSLGVGQFASLSQTSLFKIDLTSGTVLDSRLYYTGGLSFNLVSNENGYVAQVYHPNPGDTSVDLFDRQWWGSLLFVDENLDSLKLVKITETNNILLGRRSLIRTRDGGYVTEFQKNPNNGRAAVLIKTDSNGNVLWRHEEEDDTWIQAIVEMNDGGIAYTVQKDFNGMGKRVTLVKLTAEGKL